MDLGDTILLYMTFWTIFLEGLQTLVLESQKCQMQTV
jgi:hypothetical protein